MDYDCLMAYNWQQGDWPNFAFDLSTLEDLLYELAERLGKLEGLMKALPEDARVENAIEMMVIEALKSSAIEGEILSHVDVMSSIRNNLGFTSPPLPVPDKRAEGIGQLMVHIRQTFVKDLSEAMLFEWHRDLLSFDTSKLIGAWRTHHEPMQIVSGRIDRPNIHFEAPPSAVVPSEMARFIEWFNKTAPGQRDEIKIPAVRSAIAHIYFETIHPFEDGNGRIGRAISEKALFQGHGRPLLLSLSKAIESKRSEYYAALQNAQRSNEITSWIEYFLNVILNAQRDAEEQIEFTLKKAHLFNKHRDGLNERQLKVIRRMLDEGPGGFEGGMSAQKYIKIAKTSRATATRDLQDLVKKNIFSQHGGGHSTRYELELG